MRNKVFDIAKNSKFDGHQRGLASMLYNFFDKKSSGGAIKNENMSNKELAKELHIPIIRKFNLKKYTLLKIIFGVLISSIFS